MGDSRCSDPRGFDQTGDIGRGRLTFDGGVGRQDNLVDFTMLSQSGQQFPRCSCSGPMSFIGEIAPCST